MHKRRLWCVTPIATAEELAEKLVQHTWTLCTGFELQGYWFLNDATSEDAAQEYAVIKVKGPHGKPLQVESIIMSWCLTNEALDYIRKTIAGEYDDADYAATVEPKVESAEEHGRCPLCA